MRIQRLIALVFAVERLTPWVAASATQREEREDAPAKKASVGRRRTSARVGAARAGAAALAAAWLIAGGVAPAAGEPVGGGRTCLQPDATGAEQYGPTDISAVTGNRSLTAAENGAGTLTVLRWPSPSYANQLRYRTISADEPRDGVAPNEGSFLGLVINGQVRWLRDLPVTQTNLDPSSDAVTTTYRAPGLEVTVVDVADAQHEVLARRVEVKPPTAARSVVGFAHFDPTTVHFPDFPTYDWCQQDQIVSSAQYEPAADAIESAASGVGLAVGFATPSSSHQVGQDAYWTGQHVPTVPMDAYDSAVQGRLGGSSSAPGPQVDAALTAPLDDRGGATFLIAAGPDTGAAQAALTAERAAPFASVVAAKHAQLDSWLAPCPLPAGGGPAVVELARRAYISAWQAADLRGPIVASVSTQSPYGEDWVRDSAFIDHVLDLCGHHPEAGANARFLSSVQVQQNRPSPPGTAPWVPPGNWAMNYYADGTVGGPIPWEIDETGFGVWTLVDHFDLTGDRAYLTDVYPAVAAGADFLTGPGRDPQTGLTVPASEDDNPGPTYPATMHASGPTLLALRSAAGAASALGKADDARRWSARAAEVLAAIERRYHAGASGQAWTDDYGDGGWALWPVQVEDQSSLRMQAEAAATEAAVAPSFLAPAGSRSGGSYEAKALLGLAVHDRAVGDDAALGTVRRGLEWIALTEAMPGTHLLGESWVVRAGRVTTVVSQPHIWEMTLFTMAALEAWGPTSVTGASVAAAHLVSSPTAVSGAAGSLPGTGGAPFAGAALVLAGAGLLCRRLAASPLEARDAGS